MLFFLLTGCVGALDLSRATPLAPGELAIQAGGGVVLPVPAEGGELTPYFGGAASVHGGVVRGLELGGEAGLFSTGSGLVGPVEYVGVHAKIGLTDPDSGGPLHLSLDPHLRGFGSPTSFGDLGVDVPLLLGLDVGRSQLVLAPRVGLYGPPSGPVVTGGVSAAWSQPFGERVELLTGVSTSFFLRTDGSGFSASNVFPGASLGVRVRLD